MRVQELAVVVDLAREVGIVLLCALENDTRAVRQLVRGEVDLAKAALSDQAAEGVIADGAEVGRRELGQEGLVGVGKLLGKSIVSIVHCNLRYRRQRREPTFFRWSCSSYSACVLAGGIGARRGMLCLDVCRMQRTRCASKVCSFFLGRRRHQPCLVLPCRAVKVRGGESMR